jgi:hypothetical protein
MKNYKYIRYPQRSKFQFQNPKFQIKMTLMILMLMIITSEAFSQQGKTSYGFFSGVSLNTNSYDYETGNSYLDTSYTTDIKAAFNLGMFVTYDFDNYFGLKFQGQYTNKGGYWALQGGREPARVRAIVTIIIPVLSRLVGYFPGSWFASGADLPKQVALEWAGWCRQPNYLLDDESLPLERYARFKAPLLAYSIDDDDWGHAARGRCHDAGLPERDPAAHRSRRLRFASSRAHGFFSRRLAADLVRSRRVARRKCSMNRGSARTPRIV